MVSVGDRVRLVVNHPDGDTERVIGDEGTALVVRNHTRYNVLVEFDRYTANGHNGAILDGVVHRCPNGHGWWVSFDEIEVIESELEPINLDIKELFGA